MQTLLNYRIFIVILTIGLCIGAVFLIRSCGSQKEVTASIGPLDITQGTPVFFTDSTRGATRWYWEFGNGDTSEEQRGSYLFPQTGKYQVRLTVNGKLEKRFIVNVRNEEKSGQSELIRIIAPTHALQGEYITFHGEGTSKDWRWEFGETGSVDAYERTAIYHYQEAGIYTVALRTEETHYPILHTIEIIPQYSENEITDVASMIGNDIREKLQAIVDQKPFNRNYNYILNTYLCNDANTLVIVNNQKKNDFYSYCNGLKIIGRKKTRIENVLIDMEESDNCIKKLIVIQTDIN